MKKKIGLVAYHVFDKKYHPLLKRYFELRWLYYTRRKDWEKYNRDQYDDFCEYLIISKDDEFLCGFRLLHSMHFPALPMKELLCGTHWLSEKTEIIELSRFVAETNVNMSYLTPLLLDALRWYCGCKGLDANCFFAVMRIPLRKALQKNGVNIIKITGCMSARHKKSHFQLVQIRIKD